MAVSLVLFVLAGWQLHTIIPDAAFSQKILKENRYFLTFINQGVSNFGSEAQQKSLYKAQQFDYNARLFNVANDFQNAFYEVRKSHAQLRDLYKDMLDKQYIGTTKTILDSIAPRVLATRDAKALKLMKLAYRDLSECRRFMRIGFNYNKFLYSVKIRYYIDAVKMARRSKRYAFLALIEINTPLEDKKEYRTQTIEEAMSKVETDSITDFERVFNLLTNYIDRKLITDTHNFLRHHHDNYGFIKAQDLLAKNLPNLTTNDAHLR